MHIEAFTLAKNPAEPQRNEDRLVICGQQVLGVVDGVTDKSGVKHDGRSGGQLAGDLIEQAIREIAAEELHMTLTPEAIIHRVNESFQLRYRELQLEAATREDPNRRFAAQAAFALSDGLRLRLLQVGDCGIRVNGARLFLHEHPAEAIVATARSRVYHYLGDIGENRDVCLSAARRYAVSGLAEHLPDASERLDPARLEVLRQELLEQLPREHPQLERTLVQKIALEGLVGLARFRNHPGPLGHGCIDGYSIPRAFIAHHELSFHEVEKLEIFSDGYLGVPEKAETVREWEQHLARIEHEDPAKVNTVLATKGSIPNGFTDDRTILIYRKDLPANAPA